MMVGVCMSMASDIIGRGIVVLFNKRYIKLSKEVRKEVLIVTCVTKPYGAIHPLFFECHFVNSIMYEITIINIQNLIGDAWH